MYLYSFPYVTFTIDHDSVYSSKIKVYSISTSVLIKTIIVNIPQTHCDYLIGIVLYTIYFR